MILKNKKILFLFVLLLPASIKLLLDCSTTHCKKMPIYGQKLLTHNDTVYQKFNTKFLFKKSDSLVLHEIDSVQFPMYVIMFVKQQYITENFRLDAFIEYLKYKSHKIKKIPFFIATISNSNYINCFDKLFSIHPNVHKVYLDSIEFAKQNLNYFIQKPYYIDFSFMILIDNSKHIRGYYDSRYASEIKRLTEEFEHLKIKEFAQNITNTNKLKHKNEKH